MVFASRSNRCLGAASEENCAGKILIATLRPRRVSRARYTSPIPPAPSGETISYGPSLAPRVSATVVKLYLAKQNAGDNSCLYGTAPQHVCDTASRSDIQDVQAPESKARKASGRQSPTQGLVSGATDEEIIERQVVSAPQALREHSLARALVRRVRRRHHREKRPRFRSSRQRVRQELR